MTPAFRVLMVEDNPDHAVLLRRCLERAAPAVEIQHARDGNEALDYLFNRGEFADPAQSPRPDLVFLDMQVPRVSGLSILKAAKADRRTSVIPVIMFSSSAAETDVHAAYAHGANSYVVKPLSYVELKALVAAITRYWIGHNVRAPGFEGPTGRQT